MSKINEKKGKKSAKEFWAWNEVAVVSKNWLRFKIRMKCCQNKIANNYQFDIENKQLQVISVQRNSALFGNFLLLIFLR